MNVATAFKNVMNRRGVSALELSKRLGVNRKTIYKRIGNGSNPTLKILTTYCNAIGCTLVELFEEAERCD